MFDKVLFYVSLPIKNRKQKVELNLNEKPYKDIRYYKKKRVPCACHLLSSIFIECDIKGFKREHAVSFIYSQ